MRCHLVLKFKRFYKMDEYLLIVVMRLDKNGYHSYSEK